MSTTSPDDSSKPPLRHWPHAPPHWNYSPGTFMITGSTLHRANILKSPAHLDIFTTGILTFCHTRGWRADAWAVMANHYHMILRTGEDSPDFELFARTLHSKTARELNELDGTAGRRVWYQFWETKLTFEASYLTRLTYVNANPVKHRLVKNALDYPWCSAAWFKESAPRAFYETVRRLKTDKVEIDDDF